MVIVEVFTEALGRQITIDDLIEKPEHSQHPITPQEPRTIDDKIDGINQQLEGIRQEIGKLNEHHADHLKYHQSKAED